MHSQQQAAFRALADPNRRQMLMHLSERDMTIGELVDQFAITRAAVRKHLTVLEQGRLVSVRAEGRERISRLEPAGMHSVLQWMTYFDQFWDSKLAKLKAAAESAGEQ